MTTQTEALKLALDGGSLYEITGRIEDIDKCIVHRSVIKEALAQLAVTESHKQEPCPDKERDEYACKNRYQCWEPCGELGKSEEHVRVAQPEQEPVAYIKAAELEELKHCNGMSLWAENAAVHTDDSISKQLLPSGHVPVYTTPPQPKEPEQEPVAYFNPQVKGGFYWAKPTKITAPVTVNVEPMPLYTTPPQRKPLTDDQIFVIKHK